MQLGMHMHELWHMRPGLVLSLLIATFVSVTSAYKLSLDPPSLQPRALEMAAASTQVLVDNPDPVLLDLNQGGYQLGVMSQRADLLGNVMTSLPVREFIARRAGVPAQVIQMQSPTTPQSPRPIASPQDQRRTTDLLRSNNQYRINVQANPTVPILDVYTEASSVQMAKTLANAAVDGLGDYLKTVARIRGVAASEQVRLDQLGRAEGGAVTGGVNVKLTLLSFLFVFALSSCASLIIARVVRGWRLSREAERHSPARPDTAGGTGHLAVGEIKRSTVVI